MCAGKEKTVLLDFANKPEEIHQQQGAKSATRSN